MGKKGLKQAAEWFAAFLLSAVCMNFISFGFYHPCRELPRSKGATTGFLVPGDTGLYGLEGYGLRTVDRYGYVNPDLPKADGYVLVAGASHTEGFFLPEGLRFSDLLNGMLGGEEELKAYNIGKSGNYFSVVLQHLDGILGEFPDAGALVIETDSLAYDTKALRDSVKQAGYDPDETAEALWDSLSPREKLLMKVKDLCPLLRVLHKQFLTWQLGGVEENAVLEEEASAAEEFDGEYRAALSDLMRFIRGKTDKQVILVFHPAVAIEKDGSMRLLSNGAEPFFAEACREQGIDFIDMSDRFLREYRENYCMPYGFWNTTMGVGHTNREAHRMMADEIFRVLRK